MDYISVKEAAEQWQVSQRWVQKLCKENRIDGGAAFRTFLYDSEGFEKACRS